MRAASLFVAGAIAALTLSPPDARAQSWTHGWTLCTVNNFSSCHSVAITTNAVMSGWSRVGTTISISMHNLQGQGYAYDNTTTSGLYQTFFVAPGHPLGTPQGSVGGTTTGGATGGGSVWQWYTGNTLAQPGLVGYASAYGNNGPGYAPLGGCGTGTLFYPFIVGSRTCAAGSLFTVTFSIADIVDANEFSSVYIYAANDQTASYCFSDPADYSTSYSACAVHGETLTNNVVPEPVTLALLGTGLFGVGGARLRRRKKNDLSD